MTLQNVLFGSTDWEKMEVTAWILFALSCLFLCVVLYLPGCIVLRGLGMLNSINVGISPLLSLFLLFVVSSLFFIVRVNVPWFTILASSLFICIILYLVGNRWRRCDVNHEGLSVASSVRVFDFAMPALYICVGSFVTFLFFIKTLDGPESFITLYDNAFHLNLIRSFSSSGYFSPLASSLDLVNGLSNTQFYPAMLHSVAALATCALDIAPSEALNSALSVFCGLVFPLGMFSLIKVVSGNDYKVQFCGAFLVLAFGAFPWRLLQWGPLYPNLASYSLLPSFLVCFILIFKEIASFKKAYIVFSSAGIITMAVTQTNADFTAAVILIPFCIYHISSLPEFKGSKKGKAAIGGFVAFVIGFWIILYHLPFLSAIVSYTWAPVSSTSQAAINVLNLSFTGGMAQPLLALFVVIGVAVLLVKWPKCRWMVASYCLLVIIFLVSSSTAGPLQHILSGFWYTDSNRTAASVAVVAIPIASFGLAEATGWVAAYAKKAQNKFIELGLSAASVLVIVALVFAPNHYVSGVADITTSFGATGDYLTRLNMLSAGFSLSKDELAFADEVQKITGSDSVVLNNPFDGSVFLYSSNNINVYFKSFVAFGEDDSAGIAEDRDLRREASNYLSNSDICQLMKECGIQYVIQLDAEGWGSSASTFDNNYSERFETYFNGIQNIDENSPGFSLVLSSGDMRLYKVDY